MNNDWQIINNDFCLLETLKEQKGILNIDLSQLQNIDMLQGKTQDIDQFIRSIKDFSFQQRYFKWSYFLKQLQLQQSQYYLPALQKFVEHYPFNHTSWSQLCEIYLTQKGKAATLKMYQVAVNKNPRCISLWEKYLNWLKKSISKNDPNYLKNQFQKATKIIGNHYKASFIFSDYISMEKDILRKYNMYKKAMVSPLEDIDQLFIDFCQMIENLDQEGLNAISEVQKMVVTATTKQALKNNAKKLYQPTKQHVAIRYEFESKISLDEYKPYENTQLNSLENWRNYIGFIKNSGNLEFLPSLYERALITQCDSQNLWEEYFMFLENEEQDHHRAVYLLRSHSTFFMNLSSNLNLIYYWIELQQREDPSHARQLYMQIQKQQYCLQAYLKHIQLEIRAKEYVNAKKIYETAMTVFSANIEIVSFLIVEYAEFQIKHFRELKFAKKMLKEYFQSNPFNEYLFFNYLDFYSKNVQYKEGSKQGKEAYEEYVHIIVVGLKGAMQFFQSSYYRIKKMAINKLRNYVTSIYLLKTAEKKIKEQEVNIKKDERAMKRTLEQFQDFGNQQIQYMPKKIAKI